LDLNKNFVVLFNNLLSKILGQVKIGKKCRIGAGAILLPGVKVGDFVVVGAGAVVTKNVEDKQTVIGIPATPIG